MELFPFGGGKHFINIQAHVELGWIAMVETFRDNSDLCKYKNFIYLSRNQFLNDVGTWFIRTSEQIRTLFRIQPSEGRTPAVASWLGSCLWVSRLPSIYTMPSGSLLNYHLLDAQNVSVSPPTKLKLKPLSRLSSIWFQPNVSAYLPLLLISLPKLSYQTDRYYCPQ